MAQLNRSADPNIHVEGQYLTDLQEQKAELAGRVNALKSDLQAWRSKLDNQVANLHAEVSDLRDALAAEVDGLKSEFSELRAALAQQLDMTAALAVQGADGTAPSPSLQGQHAASGAGAFASAGIGTPAAGNTV